MIKGWSLVPPGSVWDDSMFQEPLSLPGKREKQSYPARSLLRTFCQGASDISGYSLFFPRNVHQPPVLARRGGHNSILPGHFTEWRMWSQWDHKTVYFCTFKKPLIRRNHGHLQALLMQQSSPTLKDYYF